MQYRRLRNSREKTAILAVAFALLFGTGLGVAGAMAADDGTSAQDSQGSQDSHGSQDSGAAPGAAAAAAQGRGAGQAPPAPLGNPSPASSPTTSPSQPAGQETGAAAGEGAASSGSTAGAGKGTAKAGAANPADSPATGTSPAPQKGAATGTGTPESPSPSPAAKLAASPQPSATATPGVGAASVATGPIAAGFARVIVHAADATTGSGTGAVTPAPNGTVIEVRRTAGSGSFTQSCTVSDGSGACSVDVPVGSNVRYTARITGAPAGYRALSTLGYGSSDSVAATAYEFESAVAGNSADGDTIDLPTASAGTAYVSDGNSLRFASRLAVVRANPDPVSQCGAKIALVLDQSASMASSGKEATLKSTVSGLIDEMAGTPARIAGYTFSTQPGTSHPLAAMNVPGDVTSLKNWVSNLATSGYTNWDQGLYQVAGGGYDLVVFVTDGNPTTDRTGGTASGTGSVFQFAERGIYSANAIKGAGTRIVALGVGVQGTGAAPNLAAISGPASGSDYYTASDSGFGQVLHDLVTANCQGKLFITKQVEPWNGSAADRTAVAGWPFQITPGGGTAQTVTTPASTGHTIEFPLTFPQGTTSRQVTVTEPDLGGYSVIPSGGKNAVCTVGAATTNVATNAGTAAAPGFAVTVGAGDIVTCTMTNKQPSPAATVQVDKQWVINGAAPVPDGQQGFGLTAALSLGGAAKSFGSAYTGYAAGGSLAIAETFTPPSAQCRLVSSSITGLEPSSGAAALPATVTLQAGTNHYRITNTVTCDGKLTLNKVVDNTGGGSKTIADFPLRAEGPAGTVLSGPDPVPGPSAGLTGFVPAGTYTLSETSQDGYAASAWTCTGGAVTGAGPGAATVTVPGGGDVTCTVTNTAIQPRLTLVKKVDRAGTGDTTSPSAWVLSAQAQGQAPAISTSPTLPVPGDADALTTAAVPVPAGTYALSESGPGSFASLGYVCGGSAQIVTSVTLALGQNVTCVVTNRAPARVVVAKSVAKLTDGGWVDWNNRPVAPGDKLRWTLSATNTSLTGYSGPLFSDNLDDVIKGTSLAWALATFQLTHPALTGVQLSSPSPAPSGNVLSAATLPGQQLGAGASASLSFEATVLPAAQLREAGLTSLHNVLLPGPSVTPCAAAGTTCETDNPFQPQVSVSKTVTKLVDSVPTDWDGKNVVPGDTLTWAITVTNSSAATATGELFTDDLSEVLLATDLTTAPGNFTADPAGALALAVSGSELRGSAPGGGLAPGQQVTLSYTATVRPYAQLPEGITSFANVVVPRGVATCEDGGQGPDCTTTNDVPPSWTIVKTSAPASGAVAQPGQPISYTLTVRNTGASPVTGITVTDSLAAVLPFVAAPPVILPSGAPAGTTAAYSAGAVTWSIGSLPAGGVLALTYTVTVADDAWGQTIRNVVTGTGQVPPADCGAALPARATAAVALDPCSTTHQVPRLAHLTLMKSLQDEWGGEATAASWDLSADGGPQAGRPASRGVVTAPTGTFDYDVVAATYALSEAPGAGFPGNPAAYTASSWTCATDQGGEPVPVAGSSVTLAPGAAVTCQITNTAIAPRLTLFKRVAGAGPGGEPVSQASPADWLVRAQAGQVLEGPGDLGASGAINSRTVPAGVYRLSEAPRPGFDPAGFTAGEWTCTQPGSEQNLAFADDGAWFVNVGLGQQVRCFVVNTEEAPSWTLAKSSVPPSGSRVNPGESIEYSVTARYLGGVPQDITVRDDLSGVLGAASLDAASITPAPVSVSGGIITWHVAGFKANQTFRYTVTVRAGAYGTELRNVATGTGTTPPQQCGQAQGSQCTTTHETPAAPELKLTKTVAGAPGISPALWVLGARPDGVSGTQPHPAGALSGRGGIDYTPVLPGTYELSERAATAAELGEGASPADPSTWRAGPWRCTIANRYDDAAPSVIVLGASARLTLKAGDRAVCEVVNSATSVDLVLAKTTPGLSDQAVLDAPDQFDYRITVTNKDRPAPATSAPATGVVISDTLPAHLKLLQEPHVAGWQVSHTGADDAGLGGTLTLRQAPGGSLAPGETASFTLRVQVFKGAQGDTVNTACVTSAEGDVSPADNCDTVTTRTKAIIVQAEAQCVLDAGHLKYSITTRNVPADQTSPVTATWRDAQGNVVRVDTLTGDKARSGDLLWPGAEVNADGVSIGWPGWRPIRAGETPQFEDMILDPSLPSYAWRQPMTVTFQVNPETTIATVYPSATPRCEATRNPGVLIAKTASVERSGPGQSYDYAIDVKNTGLGAAHDLVVSDQIAGYLKVTGVDASGTTPGVAARWGECAVTGQDSGGYGGTLTCRLDNVLGYQQQAPPITLHVQVHPAAVNSAYLNTAKVCWSGASDGCNTAKVTVDADPAGSGGLAFTGASVAGATGGALGVLLAGLGLWLLSRQLRRRRAAMS